MKPRTILFVLSMLLSVCGCATSDSKEDRGVGETQSAADAQYIVVPVFILSVPQDGLPGNGGDVLPAPNSPDHAGRRGESFPIKM